MKLTTNAKLLADALAAVAGVVPSRTTKPVLAHVLLTVKGGHLSASATDTEVGVYRFVDATEADDAAVLIDPRKVGAWLKEVGGDVTIDATGETVKFRSGKAKIEHPKLNADEFPEVPDGDGEPTFTLPFTQLAGALERTAFAADKKEGARWATTGVLLKSGGGSLHVVATDTKRLALVELTCDGPDVKANVPAKAVDLLLKSGAGGGDEVRVTLSPNAAVFRSPSWTIHTRLVEGAFPPYQKIIPTKWENDAEVEVAVLAKALRTVMPATDDLAKRADFDFGGGACKVTTASNEANGETEFAVPGFDGACQLALDPQFVLDGLKAMAKEKAVRVQMTDDTKPVLFRNATGYTYLVMPLGERGN